MRCEGCGSKRINYERDALLMATALRLEDGTLILDSSPTAEGLDHVQLRCADCGRIQQGVEWEDEHIEEASAEVVPADAEDALDRIAAFVNEPGDCNGGDLVDFVSRLLLRTGRPIIDFNG